MIIVSRGLLTAEEMVFALAHEEFSARVARGTPPNAKERRRIVRAARRRVYGFQRRAEART